MVVATFNSIYW